MDRKRLIIGNQDFNAEWPWKIVSGDRVVATGSVSVDESSEDAEGAAEYILDNCGYYITGVTYPAGDTLSLR